MKTNNFPWIGWLLAICCLALFASYVLQHDFYGFSDTFWEMDAIRSAHRSWLFQDIQLIVRPGYLLNLPFYDLGFNLYGLKLLCFCLEVISWLIFAWVILKENRKTSWLPVSLIIFTAVYATRYQMILNYYSLVLIFILLGFAAFWSAIQENSVCKGLLAGCLLALGGLSNFGMAPAFLIVMILTVIWFRNRVSVIALLSYLVVLLVVGWVYLHFTNAWQLYQEQVLHSHTVDEIKFALALAVFMLVVFIILNLIPAVILLLYRSNLRQRFLFYWAFLCFVAFAASPLWVASLKIGYFMHYLAFPFVAVATTTLLMAMHFGGYLKGKSHWLWLILAVLLLCFLNKSLSRTVGVVYLYLPVLFVLLLTLLKSSYSEKFGSIRLFILFLIFMANPLVLILTLPQTPNRFIGVNQLSSKRGVLVDRYTYHVEQQLLKSYKANHCTDKPFFAFYDFASAYWLTGRQPAFNMAYVSWTSYAVKSRYMQSEQLIAWLEKQSHWCVAFKKQPWPFIFPGHLIGLQQWLMRHANQHISLGRLAYQHTSAWLLVK